MQVLQRKGQCIYMEVLDRRVDNATESSNARGEEDGTTRSSSVG
jgi:hypothetical protein